MFKIIRIIFGDISKKKTTLFFIITLAVMSWISFILEDNVHKGLLIIMNVILFIIPLMSLLFSTVYLHNCKEFIILLLSQPVARSTIWKGIFAGVSLSLSAAFLLGAGIPILAYSFNGLGFLMIFMGLSLTLIFVSLAFFICSFITDKSKGVGIALVLWLFFAIIYDGAMLFVMFQFADYPIDNFMIAMLMINPVDLARLQLLIQLDISAIMGYAGAVFKNFLSVKAGMIVTLVIMLLWILLPYYMSIRRFNRKDM